MRLLILALAAISVLTFTACGGKKLAEGGYAYTHHVKKGGAMPQIGDVCELNIVLKNGDKVLRSTYQDGAPISIPIDSSRAGQPISPVVAGLKLMSVGDSLTIFYPIDTLKNKPAELADAKMLTYEMTLVKIINKADYAKQMEEKQKEMMSKMEAGKGVEEKIAKTVAQTAAEYKAKKLDSKIKTTASGLKYMIVEEGTEAQPAAGQTVTVDYFGALTDGKKFDSSFSRGEPISFPIGRGSVIKGWDEGLALLKVGSKAYFFIPSELGYGEAGSPPGIPANAELVFYVELLKAK